MADQTLIEGAQKLANASSKFIDYGGAIKRGLDKSQEESRVRNINAKKRVQELNNRVQKNYDKLDGNVDFTGLKGQQLADTKDAVAGFVSEYHAAADENARINDPMSAASKAAQNRMNDAQQKIVNVKNGLDVYADKTKLYNGGRKQYSGAGGNELPLAQGNYIFGIDDEQSKFQFDQNGNLGFAGELGISNIVDYSMPLVKAEGQAMDIPKNLITIENKQSQLSVGNRSSWEIQTTEMLNKDGVMESFLAGDFQNQVMKSLFDGIEYDPKNEKGMLAQMQARIMNEYDLAAARGVSAKKREESPDKPTTNENWKTTINDAAAMGKYTMYKAPSGRDVIVLPAGQTYKGFSNPDPVMIINVADDTEGNPIYQMRDLKQGFAMTKNNNKL